MAASTWGFSFNLPIEAARPIHAVGDHILQWFVPVFDLANGKTKDWPLVAAEDAFVVVVLYIIFVLLGYLYKLAFAKPATTPKESNKGKSIIQIFSGEPLLIFMTLYNVTQVVLCSYMVFEALRQYTVRGLKPICNAVDWTQTGQGSVLWVFYCSKVLDFFDTIFIVLRGKWSQFSVLHTYHHASIFSVYWLLVNVGYDGDIFFTIALNSFVHLVMYFYYFVTTLGFTVPKVLKKAITSLQMIQFVAMNVQAIYTIGSGCIGLTTSYDDDDAYGRRVWIVYLVYIISLFLLFNDFRVKTYNKTPAGEKKKK